MLVGMPTQLEIDPEQMADDLQHCRRCELWKRASQAVPGEGSPHAAIMLIGEQPGDEEDLRGRPFVGPAGRILDHCLEAAALKRGEIFITNSVKHFKWEPRGKRRLHKKPSLHEIEACNVWLHAEIGQIQPTVLVTLGATALRALLGKTVTIEAARRQSLTHGAGAAILATYHPSAILRAEGDRAVELQSALIADLKLARDQSKRPEAPRLALSARR